MKLVIITRGDLPVPATKGGAVETLTDLFIEKNNISKKIDLIIYSISDESMPKYDIHRPKTKYINIPHNNLQSKINNAFLKIRTQISKRYQGNYYILKVIEDLKKQSFDYIMIENAPLYAICIKKYFPNAKIIQHLHNSYITKDSLFLEDILKSNDFIFGVSEFIKKEVIAACIQQNQYRNNVYTWYNAINEKTFKINSTNNNLKTELGFNTNDFIILFTGRIVEAKGIDKLLESMRYLVNTPNIKLLIVGGTSFANSKRTPFLTHILKLCNTHKEQIKFTGYINHDQIYNYYYLSDVCVFPSIWNEPFALTALEAMTAGKPLIVTNSGGLPEVVDNKCAIILEKNNNLAYNIAESIKKLYNNTQLRSTMGNYAQERAKQFSSKSFYNRFNELLELIS